MNERQLQRESEIRYVTIREVNPAERYIEVYDGTGTGMRISMHDLDPLTVIPAPGEVWVVSRRGYDWYLEHQIDDGSPVPVTALSPGDRRISTSGKIYLQGSDVVINGELFSNLMARIEALEALAGP